MLLAMIAAVAPAADEAGARRVTFTEDVAPILLAHCAGCHRPGEIAPMSLLTYEETRPWAKSIKEMVLKGAMPPWFADPAYGKFRNERRLTADQIALLAAWVDQGAPQGDPAAMPPIPDFPVGWELGEPDYIVELPEVDVPANVADLFPNLIVPLNLPEERWVRAVEIRPSNRLVNHHVVLFMNAGGAALSEGGFFDVLATWAVGTGPTVFPEGMGRRLRPNQRLVANMHYHATDTPQKDVTRVGFYFGQGELNKEINAVLAGDVTFRIPPGVDDFELRARHIVDQDIQLVSYFPHMHMRGKAMTFTARYPDGRRETLLHVPNYDFNWQLFYYPEEPVELPAGTLIEIDARYDNSARNPNNPDPSRALTFGLQSTDEMMFGVFEFVAKEGVRPKAITPRSRLEALLRALGTESVYRVDLALGQMKVPTALVLPREGRGELHVPFGPQMTTVPVRDVVWSGDAFTFRLDIMGIVVEARGEVRPDGSITGAFTRPASPAAPPSGSGGAFLGMFNLQGFEGQRAG